jgi:hypothetical protein
MVSLAIVTNPFSTLNISGRGIFVFVFIPLVLALLDKIFLKGSQLRLDRSIKLLVIFFIYSLLALIWSPVTSAVGTIQVVVLVLSIGLYYYNENEQKMIRGASVVSLVISCILVYLSSIGLQEDGRASIMFLGTERDPNYVSLLFFPGLAVLLKVIFDNDRFIIKIISIALVLITMYSMLRMGTRGGLSSCVFIVVLSFLCYRKRGLGGIIGAIVFFFLLLYLYPMAVEQLPDSVADRFTKDVLENDEMGNRIGIWKNAIAFLTGDNSVLAFLFGNGTGSSIIIIGVATHNFIIQYLIDNGLLGIVLLFLFIFSFVKKTIKTKNYLPLIIFMGSFFMALSLSIAGIVDFWMNIAVAFALLSSPNRRQSAV